MSGKIIRSIVAAALLALVMLSNTPVVNAPLLSKATGSSIRMAVEHDTTAH